MHWVLGSREQAEEVGQVMFSQTTIGRGFSIQIFPFGETRWGAVELEILDSKLSFENDMMHLAGDSMIGSCFSRRQSIRMETEASSGNLMVFDTFALLEKWLKTKCNKLWPNCHYCGLRYVADEVTCSGCGGPRGDDATDLGNLRRLEK